MNLYNGESSKCIHYCGFETSLNKIIWKMETTSVIWWSDFLATDSEVCVQFLALLDFLRSSGSGMGSTQPCEYN
jgi:hypothetical protein